MTKPKILLLDTETSPNTAFVWRLFKQTIPIGQLIESSFLMCWSAKWLGEEEILFDSFVQSSHAAMLKRLHKLMSEADAVVTYNGESFDIPVVNREFLIAGLPPPIPYKSDDLYRTIRRKFRFVSNKLDYICQQLELGEKRKTDFKLWVDCMNRDKAAWSKMKEYNLQDVLLLEKLYFRILPWIQSPLNRSVLAEAPVCSKCGCDHLIRKGWHITRGNKYRRYQCKGCGAPVYSSTAGEKEPTKLYPL